MNVGLQITYLYDDTDIIEVRIVVENQFFRGTADVYVGKGQLSEAAAALEGFPKDRSDKREVILGSSGPHFAGGSVRLEFYCKDLAGHAAFRAFIEEDYRQDEHAQCATIFVDFEPAALDRFLTELQQVEHNLRGSATLILQLI